MPRFFTKSIRRCDPFRHPLAFVFVGIVLISSGLSHAADLAEAEATFLRGDYEAAQQMAAEEVARGVWNEQWSKLLIRCQLTRGEYAQALQTYEKAISRYSSSLSLRLLGRDVLRMNGQNDRAKQEAALILLTLQRSPTRYLSRDNMIAAGRYFAESGEDAREVLELFYDRVRDVDPNFVEAYIATAELALSKGDYKVAGDTLAKAAKLSPDHPMIAFLAYRAWQPSDSERATLELERAVQLNPNHVPSMLARVDHWIDRERYDEAREMITSVLEINPHQWEAWCYLAVLAHLDGKFEIESLMRQSALSSWAENPEVDYLIGRKLSDKYRFAEGAEYQRRSLTIDPSFHESSFQLSQDLLRLGFDDVGWELAEKVSTDDPYNVVAHNLVTLHDTLSRFSVLSRDDIHIRMEPSEAEIYGEAVIDLLSDAKRVLCEKYGVVVNEPIFVEIFPAQKDFAIRTFGLPGGDGFLGVCFGRVVTANSPASQGPRPSNWQSVLWHEFCHVVTLEKTRNRMPRWLSEGISVYEERQRNPSWGEHMSPVYRMMMLGDDLTPVSELSGAFLTPKSGLHLQFAYFESSLVVEYLIDKHGLRRLREILDSLGDGLSMQASFERSIGSMERLDVEFAEYARNRARSFAPLADWSSKVSEKPTQDELVGWSIAQPNQYDALQQLATLQMSRKQWESAKQTLQRLVELGVVSGSRDGVLEQLARVYRELNDRDAELETLRQVIDLSGDALPALERLIDHARASKDWTQLAELGERVLAIHPLRPLGHEAIMDAGRELDRPQWVARGAMSLLQLDPVDAAGLHYQCARALASMERNDEAKHHVLRALADAPRYRAAHQLLYQLTNELAE